MRIQQRRFRPSNIFRACPRAFVRTHPNSLTQVDDLTLGIPSPPLPPLSYFPMSGGSVDLQRTSEAPPKPKAAPAKIGSALLHRTPWTPPTAVRASGINIELEDGSQVIDAIGGAAVACLGMGNQKVINAITNQLGILTCKSTHVLILFGDPAESRHCQSPRVTRVPKRNKTSQDDDVVRISWKRNISLLLVC